MSQSFKSPRNFSLATLASNKSSFFNETLANQSGEMTEQPSTPLAAVCVLVAVALPGTIGNLLVLKAILSVKRKKVYEYLILNLAVTDAGTCIVSIPLDIVEKLSGRFPYGAALCRVIYPFQSVLVYVSVMTLFLMSVERYRLIVTPMKRAIGINTGFIIIVGIWILSCLVVLPFSFALKLTKTGCSEQWPNNYSAKVFTLAIFIFLYLGPLSFMTFFYSRMIYVFCKEIKALKERKRKKSISKELIDARLHRNAKIVKVFVFVMIAFGLCMLPTHVIWLLHDFGEGFSSSDFGKVVTFSNILVYCNSVLDPLILCSIMADFRAEVKHCRESFCCCLKRFRRSWDLEQVFVLRISPTSLTEQYKNRSYFLSG